MATLIDAVMQIFFIVGAQKSGTTWLQKSLNSVEGIHCLGEGHFVDKLLLPMAQTRHEYNKMMQVVDHRIYEGEGFYGGIPDQELFGLTRSWILNIMVRNAKAPQDTILALGDKTPGHSFHLPTLKQLFPAARFLHILRDGRDVAVSAFHHRQRIQQGNGHNGGDLQTEVHQYLAKWAGVTRAIRKAERGGIPVHTVRYEAMLNDSLTSLRGCVEHLLPENTIDDGQLQAAVDANSFQALSGGREPGTVEASAILRRGQAGCWKDELTPEAQERFSPEDCELLSSLGYTV